MLDMYKILRPVLHVIQAEESIKIYKFAGQKFYKGVYVPLYHNPVEVHSHVQAKDKGKLSHTNTLATSSYSAIFYVNIDEIMELTSLKRVKACGGDIVERRDGTFWLVTDIIDDFTASLAWFSFLATLQNIKPDFSHSSWYAEENESSQNES